MTVLARFRLSPAALTHQRFNFCLSPSSGERHDGYKPFAPLIFLPLLYRLTTNSLAHQCYYY